ncbi:MAG: D-glycero-beta-D-manno-heptose 1-phosphate adenylyltransferase [Bacteroidota bacterium]
MNKSELIESKIPDQAGLERMLAYWRFREMKIVFTNGCFDLLHFGHIDYLMKASELGHILVIGLNSDESVRRLKGNSRPLVPQDARARLLASLFFVDLVVLFEEDTPLNIIQTIKPDFLVKGDDYQESEIVGGDFVKSYGGKIVRFPLVPGFSTTSIENKIKETL